MSYEVYFEAQDDGSALCGQHAINNLLQGSYFTAIDLGRIGARLDQQEQNLLFSIDEDEKLSIDATTSSNLNVSSNGDRKRKYSNVSMEGLFSVDVLISALKQIEIDALPLSHPSCADANVQPDKEHGFIFYQMSHWIAYRKINDVWYDLNSQSNYLLLDPQPVRITEFYLSAQISKLQDEGFQVYVIRSRAALPALGRYAPKCNELTGEYAWYQSADIQSHVNLDKQSRIKQEEEERVKSRQLMMNDPRQYNALMRMGNNGNVGGIDPDPYGLGTNAQNEMYHQQQQWLAMQEYQQKDVKAVGSHSEAQNGIMAKISNPFSKLKKIYQEKTKELKTKMNGADMGDNGQQFRSDLERAKQESLKTAHTTQNNNVAVVNKMDFRDLNSPQIATYGVGVDNHLNYGQSQHRVNTYNKNNDAVAVDDDVQLAMALSASIAKEARANNENVELEFEITDHKPKIIQKQEQKEHDFLDLMSMGMANEENNDNDPFASLIRQYSNEEKGNNNNNEMDMDMEEVQFESNLFGDNLSNDRMDLMDDGNVINHMISAKDNNPLISPVDKNTNNNNTFNYDETGNGMALRMENNLWRMLEKSLTDQ